MTITINVRQATGAYHARAMRLGVTASSAEGATAAARAVCRKLDIDPSQLVQGAKSQGVEVFSHPGRVRHESDSSAGA